MSDNPKIVSIGFKITKDFREACRSSNGGTPVDSKAAPVNKVSSVSEPPRVFSSSEAVFLTILGLVLTR